MKRAAEAIKLAGATILVLDGLAFLGDVVLDVKRYGWTDSVGTWEVVLFVIVLAATPVLLGRLGLRRPGTIGCVLILAGSLGLLLTLALVGGVSDALLLFVGIEISLIPVLGGTLFLIAKALERWGGRRSRAALLASARTAERPAVNAGR